MALIDTHCHLNHEQFQGDLDRIIQNAKDQKIEKLFSISTKLDEIPALKKMSSAHSFIYYTVGIHPHYAEEEAAQNLTLEQLIAYSSEPKVIGIGESGLDYYYEHSQRDLQKKNFELHIEACIETDLPLIVHSRDAEDDTIRLLQAGAKKGNLRGVLHCFSSHKRLADAALELGFYISASGIITFKKSDMLRDIFSTVPLDKFLLETDAPYLAPTPMRGKKNEPAFMIYTAEKMAEIHHISLDEVKKIAYQNTQKLFSRAFIR